jgi:hypothetical protein
MTFDISSVLLGFGMVVAMAAVCCRCAALAYLLPDASKWEYMLVYRFPKKENYNDQGKQVLVYGYWLAFISAVFVGVSVYLNPQVLN